MAKSDWEARLRALGEATTQRLAGEAIRAGDAMSALCGVLEHVTDNDEWVALHHQRMVDGGRMFAKALANSASIRRGMDNDRAAWAAYATECAPFLIDLWVRPAPAGTERAAAVMVANALAATWPALRAELATPAGDIDVRGRKLRLLDSHLIRHSEKCWVFFDRIITDVRGGFPADIVEAALHMPIGSTIPLRHGVIHRMNTSRANEILTKVSDDTGMRIPWRIAYQKGPPPRAVKVPASECPSSL